MATGAEKCSFREDGAEDYLWTWTALPADQHIFRVWVGTLAYMTHAYLSGGLYSCKLTAAHNKSDHVASACNM